MVATNQGALEARIDELEAKLRRVAEHVELMATMSSPHAGDPFKVRADAVRMMRSALDEDA